MAENTVNWTPGPARCRSPEYEAEIAFTDMGGLWPLVGRVRFKDGGSWSMMSWMQDGRCARNKENPADLMPPTITREALAVECMREFDAGGFFSAKGWKEIVAHVIEAVKSGRVE